MARHRLVDRSMQLTCVIEDQQILLTNETGNLTIELKTLKKVLLKAGGKESIYRGRANHLFDIVGRVS